MKALKKYIFLLFASVLPLAGNAQQKWTLEECIRYAQENNLQIQQQQIGIEQAENNLAASKLNYIPTLNASMNHSMSWGRSVNLNDLEIIENQLSQSTSLNVSASLPLFEGMKKKNTVKSNVKQLEIAGENINKLKDDISISVLQAYLQVLLSMEIEKVAQQSLNATTLQVERTRTLVEAGSQAYSSLLEIQAQQSNERVQLVSAQNNLRSNLLNLAQLMNLQDTENFMVEVPQDFIAENEIDDQTIGQLYSAALSLPQIKGAELGVEQSRLKYRIQKGTALPVLSFSTGYGTYYSNNQDTPFFTQFNNNRNPSMGFGLSIPIFNNWKTNTAIKNAKLDIKNAEIQLKQQQQTLYKEIQQAYNEVMASREKCRALEQNVKSAEESFRYTQEKFNAGMLNGTEYTVAKSNLFKAESEYLQSRFQYLFQIKILDYYRCIPLTL